MPLYITKNARDKIAKRLESIKKQQQELIPEIKQARSYGDLSENAEYQYALERRNQLQNEELALRKRLADIRCFIEELVIQDDTVDIGTKVTIVTEDEEEIEYAIMGCLDDESPLGGKVIPYEAPLARQLLHKKLGEVVEINLPANNFEAEITKIDKLFHK